MAQSESEKATTLTTKGQRLPFVMALAIMFGFMGSLLSPAMPAVLLGVVSLLAWKLFAGMAFALAVPGFLWLRDTIFYPPFEEAQPSLWDIAFYWAKALTATLLLMPLLLLFMPGPILAFGVSVAPHLLGAGVLASSAPVVATAFMHGMVASAGILFGLIALVQTVGAALVIWSQILNKDYWEFFRPTIWIFGLGVVSTAPIVIVSVVGVAYALAGQAMLHAGRLAVAGATAAVAKFQSALALLPPHDLVFGAIISLVFTPVSILAEIILMGMRTSYDENWAKPEPAAVQPRPVKRKAEVKRPADDGSGNRFSLTDDGAQFTGRL